jgi:hypothetical protein
VPQTSFNPVAAPPFRLNPDLDMTGLADTYRATSRVRIHDLLADDGLADFYDDLESRSDWWHLMNTAGGVIELDRAMKARMGAKRRAALDAEVQAGARTGFQYRYEGLRVPDRDQAAGAADPLTAFADLMSSEPMLALLRAVTGCTALAFTDGQATAYGPGDFLTCHDDDVPGKNRLAAYVFGMTPSWRAEWGGVLLFHEADGSRVTGHVPRFNTLDLFAVPQLHSVSLVSPAAPRRRYAVTGWLRAGER